MIQSDKITEFLKYASPMLDYIEYCMEKQAGIDGTLRLLTSFEKRVPGKRELAKLRREVPATTLYRLTRKGYGNKDFTKAQNKALKNIQEFFGTHDGSLPYNTTMDVWARRAAKGMSKVDDAARGAAKVKPMVVNFDNMTPATSATADMRHTGTVNIPMRSQDKVPSITAHTPGMSSANGVALTNIVGGKGRKKTPIGIKDSEEGFSSSVNAADDAADAANDTANAANPAGFSVGNWVNKHPYLAAGTTAGVAGAGLGGLGYGIGHGSGMEEGAQASAQYHALQQALLMQQLQNANSSVGNRLLNLFGAGALNNLIGG